MAVYHPYRIKCSCGHGFTVQLARGINIQRTPELKQRIIEGSFHRATCPKCSNVVTVEKEFSYADFSTNTFIKVKPRNQRHLWKQASESLTQETANLPIDLSPENGRTLRVVFGLCELREKIIAQEYQLDDRLVELMKVLLVYEHPFLIQKPRVNISLDKITDASIEFRAFYDHDDKKFRLVLPRAIVDQFLSKETAIKEWVSKAHVNSNIFDLKNDYWINMWRWSPQPPALDILRKFASEVEKGNQLDVPSKEFIDMINYLPRGSHLPAWAKKDLNTLFNYAKARNLQQTQDQLFEIRFDKTLVDDWYLNNDPNDIDTLWKLLKDLPETNVEGNSYIHEILLQQGGGGVYDPSSNDIFIGADELDNQERFEDVVRHEVGHAVHEKNKSRVDQWLASRFGWQMFDTSNADIDAWVSLMGGWGQLNSLQQAQVRSYLTEALGSGGKWTGGTVSWVPPDHPWNRADFGPRLAFLNTGNYWYGNNANWYRRNGKAFFLNFWYKSFCVVDESTLSLVARMPSNYAAMSHFEFFAELYALYYDKGDPQGQIIPADIMDWLNQNIGVSTHGMPFDVTTAKKSFDWIRRPETR